MFEFPYMQLPGGILRPVIAVVVEGPSGRRLLDGLLDTGSDRTIFPNREAEALGIALPTKPDGVIKTAGGVSIAYRVAEVVLELRASGISVRWKTSHNSIVNSRPQKLHQVKCMSFRSLIKRTVLRNGSTNGSHRSAP